MKIDRNDTALVVIDPQNDVLSAKGVSWPLVGDSVKETTPSPTSSDSSRPRRNRGTRSSFLLTICTPRTSRGSSAGPSRNDARGQGVLRPGPLNLDGFSGSGADWLAHYKPFIEDGRTVVVSPHKVYGPQSNDLVLQLRKRRIDKVILSGMLANLCVESHLRNCSNRASRWPW